MKKQGNNYFHADFEYLLSDIREVGIGNVIADSMRGIYRWKDYTGMTPHYMLDYLLAETIENRRDYNRLYLWALYVKAFRRYYGTQG